MKYKCWENEIIDGANNAQPQTSTPKKILIKYKIYGETVKHSKFAYDENLRMYGKENVIFIEEVEV